jgi:hypothetical protein
MHYSLVFRSWLLFILTLTRVAVRRTMSARVVPIGQVGDVNMQIQQLQTQMQEMQSNIQQEQLAQLQVQMQQLQRTMQSGTAPVSVCDPQVKQVSVRDPQVKQVSVCDPQVMQLKKKCDQLMNADLQRNFLRLELEQLRPLKQDLNSVYVHLIRLRGAILKAFQKIADGTCRTMQPQTVDLGEGRRNVHWCNGEQKAALLGHAHFISHPTYAALLNTAFKPSPPFENRNKKGKQKFGVEIIAAANAAFDHFRATESHIFEAIGAAFSKLELMGQEPVEDCCCVL